jgi:hypothetical protein
MKNNLKKHDFSFNLAGLSTYTDEVGGMLIQEAVTKAKTVKIGYIQSGIKGSQAINLLSSVLNVQDGGCGWSPSGQTIFTQRDITVCSYRVNEALCPEQLNDYWAGQFLNAGSYNESVPFETAISQLKVEQIADFCENKLWQALPASSGGTDCFVGFKGLFGTGQTPSAQVNFVVSPTTPAVGDMMEAVDEVISTLPDAIQQRTDVVVLMSIANYRKYQIDLRNSNWYAFTNETREAGMPQLEIMHPGTGIMVYGVPGLINSNQIVAGPKNELVIGVDLMSDSERLDIFYDRNADEVRVRSNFKLGAQIPFPENWSSNGLN